MYKTGGSSLEANAKIIIALFLNSPDIIKIFTFINEKFIVRGKRRCYGGKVNKRGNIEILLTFGRPNFAEKEFIKQYKKAKGEFPSGIYLKKAKGEK